MRYKFISVATVLVIVSIFSYFYNSQFNIYKVGKTFKNVSNDADSPLVTISNIIGEKKVGITTEEVLSSLRSVDFVKKLAEEVYDSGEFLDHNFSDFHGKDQRSTSEIFNACGESRECMVNFFMGRLPGMYIVAPNDQVQNNFFLTVQSLNRQTTAFLLNKVESTIQKTRVESIKHLHSQQKALTQKLLNSKKEELNDLEPNALEESEDSLKESVKQLDERIRIVSRDYHKLKIELDLIDSQLEQTRRTLSSENRNRFNPKTSKRVKAINKKIEKYRQDISAIEVSLSSFSGDDKSILNQLKSELRKAERELKSIPNYRLYLGSKEDFIKRKGKSSEDVAFDSKVKRSQFARVSKELLELQEERAKTVKMQKDLSSKIKDITPIVEYIKILEQKMVQLQIIESTIISDYVFSKNVSGISVFRRTSLAKAVLFCFFVTFFSVFSLIIIRYLADSKIYDEYELSKNYNNIDVIGKTPNFNVSK